MERVGWLSRYHIASKRIASEAYSKICYKVETIPLLPLALGNPSIGFWSIPLVKRMQLATRKGDPVVWQYVSKPGPEFHLLRMRKLFKTKFPVSLGKLSKRSADLRENEFVMQCEVVDDLYEDFVRATKYRRTCAFCCVYVSLGTTSPEGQQPSDVFHNDLLSFRGYTRMRVPVLEGPGPVRTPSLSTSQYT